MAMEYDPYIVLPEEVASSVIFNREEDEEFEEHYQHVRSCGSVSKLWSFCIAKYCLILARNEFLTADYVAARHYFRLSRSFNLDSASPASFYNEFSSFVYRQINNQRGSVVGFIEESLREDSDEKSAALLNIVLHCIAFSCEEERPTYFEPPATPKKSTLVQRSLETNKLFTTPLIPLPVEPRSLTLQTMEQILSLIEVQDLNINQLLKIIREFASQGPAERKYLASRYVVPRLVNLHLGHKNNPMRQPDTKEEDYTHQITTHHQLATVFLIGAELDTSFGKGAENRDENEMMELEDGAGVRHSDIDELIPTTQLDMDMLFHKSFVRDVILNHADKAEDILPLIKEFIHHWSYQNENKQQFFEDLLALPIGPTTNLLVDLLESYTLIQDHLTESRVNFATKTLLRHIIGIFGLPEVPRYAQLLQKFTTTHPSASAVLLELRNEWLIKFYTAKDTLLRSCAEEILTDLLWSQAEQNSVLLLTETFLAVLERPIESVCALDLNPICTAIEFLGLQLEDKTQLLNALPSFIDKMFACNKMKLGEDRNNIATLTFLKTLMTSDELRKAVMTRVTDPTVFKQLLGWYHEEIKKVENEYHCGFYMFNHLALYYSVVQLCCEYDPNCLKLAFTNEYFVKVIMSHVVFAPIYLGECVNLVSALLELAWQNNLKPDLELFYASFQSALFGASVQKEFLVANLDFILSLLEQSLQDYPVLVAKFVGSAENSQSGLPCLVGLVHKAKDIDPLAIYNFDATKLLWRLYELMNDVVQKIIARSPSKEMMWTKQLGGEQNNTADALLHSVIAINETLLPVESTAFKLGEQLIDALNHEKYTIAQKNQVQDEAPPVNVPEPNPVSSESGRSSTVM